MKVFELEMTVENSPTILPKILQTIKRRRFNIRSFHADESPDKDSGTIKISLGSDTDPEQLRMLKQQLEKLVDVIDITQPANFVSYSNADHRVWNLLYTRQIETIKKSAYENFAQGLDALGFNPHKIPDFARMNMRLEKLTRWTIYPVPGLIDNKYFFEQMLDRRFGSTQWIRTIEQLNYLEEPDMFHDVFGHIPLLADPLIADFLHSLATFTAHHGYEETVIENIARLYWYTIEFGLVVEDSETKIYGAGILSSIGESEFCLSDRANRVPFDLKTVLSTPYIKDRFQEKYFVIPGMDYLTRIIAELTEQDR